MSISNLFKFLVPKDRKFFPLFESASENVLQAAILMNKMMLISDSVQREAIINEIKELEHKGDDFTHTIFDELNTTFITPFDREDITSLTSKLDDVIDYINSSCQRIKLYQPREIPEAFVSMSELILQASREIKIAIYELRNLKEPEKIKKSCLKINEIESKADEVYHNALTGLFQNETNAIELIKKKEILQTLEKATDMAEDVSDVLKTIVVKSA